MEGYVILVLVFVLIPGVSIGAIWWGVSRSLAEGMLKRLVTIDQVEARYARTSGKRKRFTLLTWEYDLAVFEAHGRAPAEVTGILSQPAIFKRLMGDVHKAAWALPLTGAPIVGLIGLLVLVTAWAGSLGLARGDFTSALLLGLAVLPVIWAYRLIRHHATTPRAWQGRMLLPLLDASPQERVAGVRAFAAEHVEGVRSLERAQARPGFSARRQTVTENTTRFDRLSNRLWLQALLAGGGLTVLRVLLRAVEAVAPSGAGAVGVTLGAVAVVGVGGWFGWRAWYRSARGRERLMVRLGAVRADAETYRPSWRALEQVAAAVGLADPPALYVVDAPVLNAAIAGATPAASALVMTSWFSELPQAEQQAAFATLMAHVVSGRAAKASAPRLVRSSSIDIEDEMMLSFSASNEIEGLQLTRTPQAHVALVERFVSGDFPSALTGWLQSSSAFADRRLWFYAPLTVRSRSLQVRLHQLRSVLGAEAMSSGATPTPTPEPPRPEASSPERPPRPRSASPGARAATDVALRCAILLLVGDRGYGDLVIADAGTADDQRMRIRERVEGMRAWASETGLDAHLTDAERELLETPVGEADEGAVINAVWAVEAVPVLLWALYEADDLLGWDARLERGGLPDALTAGDADLLAEWVAEAELRPVDEIDSARAMAEAWYWRAWMGQCEREGMPREEGPYEEAYANAAQVLGEAGWFTPVDGDFPARGVAYRTLDERTRLELRSLAWERNRAFAWLCGEIEYWDETPG